MNLDLNAILEASPTQRGPRHPELPPEIRKVRTAEQNRRASAARSLVIQALTRLHADEYDELLPQAVARVNAERGPLPGDDLA